VHGIDLSVNAIMLAIERAAAAALTSSSGGGAAPLNGSGSSSSSSAGAANGSAAHHSGGGSRQQQVPHDLTFEVADVLTRDFPPDSFDACLSRDSLLHVADKQQLLARCACVLMCVCVCVCVGGQVVWTGPKGVLSN
jgi:hypothetical protein